MISYAHVRPRAPRFGVYTEPEFGEPRDLIATTSQRLPFFTFYHPAMQEVLLQAAAEAGAEVRRGASVRDVKLGGVPTVVVEQEGRVEEIQARLIVGADGRGSVVRKWAGFPVHQDPERLVISGVLFEEMFTPQEDTIYYVISPNLGQGVPLSPKAVGGSVPTSCRPKPQAFACRERPIFPALSKNRSEVERQPSGMRGQRQSARWRRSMAQTPGWSIRTKMASC